MYNIPDLDSELNFKFSKSSGAGGQHVNKVATKVSLHLDISNSTLLNQEQKDRIIAKLSNRISKEGILAVHSESERSQLVNKKLAIKKFYELLLEALKPEKKRIPTKPTRASKEKRLTEKRKVSEKKKGRGEGSRDHEE